MYQTIRKFEMMYQKFEYRLVLISGFMILFIMLLVTADVIGRFFNKPLLAVYEIVIFMFIGLIVIGFSYVQGIKENIIIEIATESLPKLYRNILDLVGYIIGLIMVSLIFWRSVINTISSYSSKEISMGLIIIPLWPIKGIVAFGMGVLAIRLVLDILIMLFNIKK